MKINGPDDTQKMDTNMGKVRYHHGGVDKFEP